jgi:hypothetical protein
MRSEWYYKIYREVKKGLQASDNAHAIHGSLLTVGEMLKNTGESTDSLTQSFAYTYISHVSLLTFIIY